MNFNTVTIRKILILAANPQDTSPQQLAQEVRDIEEGLKRSQQRDQFSIQQRWAVSPRDIQRAMLDINPQIIHFSGQGAKQEGLIFADDTGTDKLVSPEALAGLFRLFPYVECVILNGCFSEGQPQAISQHIKYVIGISQELNRQAAIEFSIGFYDALGAGRNVEFAYEIGCSAIPLAGFNLNPQPNLFIKETPPASIPVRPENNQLADNNQAIEIFFSYAHEDEKLRNELAKHLKLLERQKVISSWYDRDITAGDDWKQEIQQHLQTAQVILLLISADFLASDFCWGVELAQAMTRHENKQALVIPVILREVDWQGAPFGKLQALPKNAKPVTNWSNQDQAFTDIARGIRKAVEKFK